MAGLIHPAIPILSMEMAGARIRLGRGARSLQRLLIFLTAATFVLVALGWPIVACVLFCVVMLAAAIVGTVSHDLVEKRKERGDPSLANHPGSLFICRGFSPKSW